MYIFLFYFLFFIIYSFIGWLAEVVSAIINDHKFTNRGFLIGPYCPIYGNAALLLYLLFQNYFNDLFVIFLISFFFGSLFEYVTSYIMEKIFNARWWDYSEKRFNLNGRISLLTSFLFGILGISIAYLINPIMLPFLESLQVSIVYFLGSFLLIVFICDFIISMNIINKLSKTFTETRKDYTDDINIKIKNIINDKSKLIKRLLKAFPNIKISSNLFKK
ncbi:MAG: putative ABC transporter permease [Bacilli bacterium]|nr:putative ABC transporter permease [Bacilli bacterium]